MAGEYQQLNHLFEPVYNRESQILLLGTFPSVKSRENQFFYGHPQNRFWRVLSILCKYPLPISIEQKKAMLLQNGIAVWDVITRCEIIGSSDSSIRNVEPTDLSIILDCCNIKGIYANGGKAYDLYMKYTYEKTGMKIKKLPSSSPANAAYSIERLVEEWGAILKGYS